MFKSKKQKEQEKLEITLKQIQEEREALKKEKDELQKIKELMDYGNKSDAIDISNLYIWEVNGVKNIVKLYEREIQGRSMGGLGKLVNGYATTLVDIFTNTIIYEKYSMDKINRKQFIGSDREESVYGNFYPLYEEDQDFLAFPDKKVPMYILRKVYYKINNVDINAAVLKLLKK